MKLLNRKNLNVAIESVGLIISFTVFIILMSQVWFDVTFDRCYPESGRIFMFERPQPHVNRPEPFVNLMNRPQIQTIRDASADVEAVAMRHTQVVDGTTLQFAGMDVTANYLDLFGFEVIQGRGFTQEDGEAAKGSYVVNEAFLRAYPQMGVGSLMKGIRTGKYSDTDAEIVGVVKDFRFRGLTYPVEPFAFYCSGEPTISGDMTPRYFRMAVKTVDGKAGDVAGKLVKTLNKIIGGKSNASCQTLENQARKLYGVNAAESALVRTSSMLSLLLALLGIFGLIFLEAQTIRKSVAIRKVYGALEKDLIWMMLKKYVLLGTVVFAASIPLAIWVIRRWLEQFSEKAPVPVWLFLVSWLLVIGTTVAVIASMALITARTNPAEELKKE